MPISTDSKDYSPNWHGAIRAVIEYVGGIAVADDQIVYSYPGNIHGLVGAIIDYGGGGGGGGGSGTVTSVGLSMPSVFAVTGTPITTTGTFTVTLASQASGLVLASPPGGSGVPSFQSIATGHITNQAVTLGKIETIADGTFLGNNSGGLSSPIALTATQSTALLNTFSDVLKGLTPASGGGTTNFLRADGTWASPPGGGGGSGTVTSVALSMPSEFSVSGSPVTTAGTLAVTLASQSAGLFLATDSGSAGVPSFRGISTGHLADGLVTLPKIANIASTTLLGNNTGSPAAPVALTSAQTTAILDVFTTSLKGLTPASGGGTTNFLRADGTWAPSIANIPSTTILGNNTGSSAAPIALTSAQTTAILDLFTTSLKGLVPASGGGTTNFLRADGTWALPPGGGGAGTVTSVDFASPSIFSVSGNPVTTSGTITLGLVSQSANQFWAAPNGSSGNPSFRAIVGADLGTGTANTTTYLRGDQTWQLLTVIERPLVAQGRLTLVSGDPIPTSDSSGAIIYYTPFEGNRIHTYDGSAWVQRTFNEISLNLTGFPNDTNFDVFFSSGGSLVTQQWASNTVRSVALSVINGRYVDSVTTSLLLVGTIRLSSGAMQDTRTKRFVSNVYNKKDRILQKHDYTASWTYSTGFTWRQARAATDNMVEVVATQPSATYVTGVAYASDNFAVGIGIDSNQPTTDSTVSWNIMGGSGSSIANYRGYIAQGYHQILMLENTSSSTTFFGLSGGTPPALVGLNGTILN